MGMLGAEEVLEGLVGEGLVRLVDSRGNGRSGRSGSNRREVDGRGEERAAGEGEGARREDVLSGREGRARLGGRVRGGRDVGGG